jgi:hypothetical protein
MTKRVPATTTPILPAPNQTDLRAYVLYDVVPPGCTIMQATCDQHWPHLKAGEWAMVDTREREPEHGEIFVVMQNNGPALWQTYWQVKHETWYLRAINSPRSGAETDEWLRTGRTLYLSEGAIPEPYLRSRIIGKTVGIWQPVEIGQRQNRRTRS